MKPRTASVAGPLQNGSSSPRWASVPLALMFFLLPAVLLLATTVRGASENLQDTPAVVGLTGATRNTVEEIYRDAGEPLLWTAQSRRVSFLQAVASLQSDGIDVRELRLPDSDDSHLPFSLDVSFTAAVVRAIDLLSGPATQLPSSGIAPPAPPRAAEVARAIQSGGLVTLFSSLRPQTAEYQQLRRAYLRYKEAALIENDERLDEKAGEIVLGAADPRLSHLARRLELLSRLDGLTMPGDLPEAVKAFQMRRGLTVDARVGPATLAELNAPLSKLADQIAANLAAWRQLPRQWPENYVTVNAASASLEFIENGALAHTARVIVGSPAHPTPIFASTIGAVTFNPGWTVPRSIAVNEILPKLHRQNDYLQRNNFVILGREADPYGLDINWRTYDASHFRFQLHQAAGPKNPLGAVKFEMPNAHSVYLHDTPNQSPFVKAERALSHGCVRVEDARALATRLINSPQVWLERDLERAIADGRTVTVPLLRPMPVYILYFTAFVADGALNFRRDIYGRYRASEG